MSGLPYSDGFSFPRPESAERTTPFPRADPIPIDPVLHAPQLDPTLMSVAGAMNNLQSVAHHPSYQPYPFLPPRQYAQGPQGDPFAPQPPPAYFHLDGPAPTPARPLKKKRQPRREEECGYCQGDELKNKDGVPELMVTCADCRRSVHPSCMDLSDIAEVMRSYDWKCAECKNCEVCHEKEGDNRMMFCDYCDRGWHMDCLDPPLTETPPGRWHCPLCPPVHPAPPQAQPLELESPTYNEADEVIDPQLRQTSVASTSHIPQPEHPESAEPMQEPVQETPHEAIVVSESDDDENADVDVDVDGDVDMDVDVDIDVDVDANVDVDRDDPPASLKKSHKKSKSRWKGKAPIRDEAAPDEPDLTSIGTRSVKRMRLRLGSPAPPSFPPKTMPVIRLRLPPRTKGKAREEEQEEPKPCMFDDLLSPEDRDTTGTSITSNDKQRFDKSRVAAEEKVYPRPAPSEVPPETAVAGPSSRPLLRSTTQLHVVTTARVTPERSQSPSASTPGPMQQKLPTGMRIQRIRFGDYDIEAWYDAPFPEEYASIPDGRLWLCEYCLKYMKSRFLAGRHQMKCKMRHPPGDEIYRDGTTSIFEVDGRKNKIYCQNLCLLSKMFLDHKSLFYDVEPFLFYVMTEVDETGAHFVGYFSKEKQSPKDYNVSCIMTLPVRQRQGWGNLLIDFSYLLSKKEGRSGSPEKPLSALGALGYKNYWTLSLMRYLQTAPPKPRFEDISAATSMTIEDIYATLVQLNMIRIDVAAPPMKPLPGQSIKFPKGRKNGVARKHLQRTQTHDDDKVKGPFVPPKEYEIHWDPDDVEQYLARWQTKNYLTLKPEKLKWSPFILARTRRSGHLPANETESAKVVQTPATATATAESDGTPGLDVLPTPRAGTSVDPPSVMSATRSPALALFDDDDVIIISSSKKEPPAKVTQDPVVRSPSVPPPDALQLEQDRALALQMAKEQYAASRRLRSRDMSSDTARLETAKTVPKPSPSPRKARPTRNTVSTPTSSARVNGNHRVVDASPKTTRNGVRPVHELRSRSNVVQDRKRAASPSRSMSPRKRRRVESPVEIETEPTPPPARRSLRHATENIDTSPRSTRPQRKSTRLTNGNAPRSPSSCPPSASSLSSLSGPSDFPAPDAEPPDNDKDVNMIDVEEQQQEEPLEWDQMGMVVDVPDEDMKFDDEDAETPMTAATGRHSVPSDDTVFVAEDAAAQSKVSPAGPPVDVQPVIPAASKEPSRGDVVDASERAAVEDENADADAEGEEDVDAEGELDEDA